MKLLEKALKVLGESKKVLTVKYKSGKSDTIDTDDIDEFIEDIDMYMQADNLPKCINQMRNANNKPLLNKSKMIALLKDIKKGKYKQLDLSQETLK